MFTEGRAWKLTFHWTRSRFFSPPHVHMEAAEYLRPTWQTGWPLCTALTGAERLPRCCCFLMGPSWSCVNSEWLPKKCVKNERGKNQNHFTTLCCFYLFLYTGLAAPHWKNWHVMSGEKKTLLTIQHAKRVKVNSLGFIFRANTRTYRDF